ncbi:MAG: hypothetical protein FGM56_10075 [Limnohabitans sp.]|nr:hypothetical protein [Limnohabitans sp.]
MIGTVFIYWQFPVLLTAEKSAVVMNSSQPRLESQPSSLESVQKSLARDVDVETQKQALVLNREKVAFQENEMMRAQISNDSKTIERLIFDARDTSSVREIDAGKSPFSRH